MSKITTFNLMCVTESVCCDDLPRVLTAALLRSQLLRSLHKASKNDAKITQDHVITEVYSSAYAGFPHLDWPLRSVYRRAPYLSQGAIPLRLQ